MNLSIKEVLMERDGMTSEEADELIEDAKEELRIRLENDDFTGANNICEDYFGLEPDYVDELM